MNDVLRERLREAARKVDKWHNTPPREVQITVSDLYWVERPEEREDR